MSITLDFSPADIELLQAQAKIDNVSIEEYSKAAIMKAVRNAEYLSKLDLAREQVKQGHVVYKTIAELEAMANE